MKSVPTAALARPNPERLGRAAAIAYIEIRAGLRAIEQLAPLLTPALEARIRARVQRAAQDRHATPRPGHIRLVKLRSQWVEPTQLEQVGLVAADGRIVAVAITIEHHDGRWRICELTCPEDRSAPLRSTRTSPSPAGKPDAFDEAASDEAGERVRCAATIGVG